MSGASLVAAPGHAPAEARAADDEAPVFALRSDRGKYYEGENFMLRVALRQPGAGSPSNQEACPKLYIWQRSPDRTTRIDEVKPLAFKGCGPPVLGHPIGDWDPASNWIPARTAGGWAPANTPSKFFSRWVC
ncbi:MAG TPA: hypothetical protein VG168_14785 [Bryobacteraceae bacterium]|nr:hypothetical protein [Bryobacteraceae bacterium]